MTHLARHIRTMLIAAGALGLAAAPAAAEVVTHALNLRSGPGLGHPVIAAMPAGARVDAGSCSGSWCRVTWRGRSGWASARYLSGDHRVTRRAVRREYREVVHIGPDRPWLRTRVYEPWFRSESWFAGSDWGRFGSDYSGPIGYRTNWGAGAGW